MLICVRSISRSLKIFWKTLSHLNPITFFPNWRLLFSQSLHGIYSILIVLLSVFLWTFSTSVHFEMGDVPELCMITKLWTNWFFFFPCICLTWTFFPFSFPMFVLWFEKWLLNWCFYETIIIKVSHSWEVMISWSPSSLGLFSFMYV